jgi:hypothetical protein
MTQTDRELQRLKDQEKLKAIAAPPEFKPRESFTIERFEPDARNGDGEWWECHDTGGYGREEAIRIANYRARSYNCTGESNQQFYSRFRVTRELVTIDVVWDSETDMQDGNADRTD